MSAAFVYLADSALLILGGELKRKERLSARFGDVLSHLYMASAVLKRFEDQGRPPEDLPLVEWALDDSLFRIQSALEEILRNFPLWPLGMALRVAVFPLGRPYAPPSDRTGHRVADLLLAPSFARDRLTAGIFVPADAGDILGRMDAALVAVLAAEPLERKLEQGLGQRIPQSGMDEAIDRGIAAGVIDDAEAAVLREAWQAVHDVIQVDETGDAGRIEV
jgi:acyl-CoA dehydrogenase